jgi:hypothetical protein
MSHRPHWSDAAVVLRRPSQGVLVLEKDSRSGPAIGVGFFVIVVLRSGGEGNLIL